MGHAYLIGGMEAQRWGTAHASIVPYQAFKTKDAYLVVSGANDGQFATVCKVVGLPDLPSNPKFNSNKHRVEVHGLSEPMT